MASECEICSQLKDVETSFYKFGWEEQDRPLPAAVGRLIAETQLDGYEAERHHVRRCPLCGRRYQYAMNSEYYVNGSEDEEILRRLPWEGDSDDLDP